MQPRFLYFDLGNVLVDFCVERMFRQMGEAAGIDADTVQKAVFAGGLQAKFERGRISKQEFYHAFCSNTGTEPDCDALLQAGSDIFELQITLLPVIAQLQQAGHRLGILSNTCESHWEHLATRFPILAEVFQVRALSYQIGAAKPEAAIFHAAAKLAGLQPQEIFFVDDTPDNVAGAKAAGFDAVQYTSTSELVAHLRKRRICFNY